MPHAMKVDIAWAGRTKSVTLPGDSIVVGRARECDLVLPFDWIPEHHFQLKQDAGALRVRLLDPIARATVLGHSVTREWEMLPDGSVLQLPGPRDTAMSLTVTSCRRRREMEVLHEQRTCGGPASVGSFGMEVVEESPLAGTSSLFGSAASENKNGVPLAPRAATKGKRGANPVIVASLVMFAVVASAITINIVQSSRASAAFAADVRTVADEIEKARSLIHDGKYVEAKAILDTAKTITDRLPQLADYSNQISTLSQKPEIRWGGHGYVLMDRQWLPAETAKAWKLARQRDDPKIIALRGAAESGLERADSGGDLQAARRACEQALGLMDAEPVKPHPQREEIALLKTRIENKLYAAEMIAKGMVLYQDKWITPAEKFRIEQLAKGLVEHDGKWMTKDEAFAAEQTAKGLVLYQGKWMTTDQRMEAQGFVQFEGNWVTPEQRQQVLSQRAEEKRLAEVRAAEARAAAAKIEALKQPAYEMSQVFVKRQLKAPSSAQFEKFGNSDVTVVFSDGWYLVRAHVDAQNSFGAMLRNDYICKLRPTSDPTQWEQDGCFLLDN